MVCCYIKNRHRFGNIQISLLLFMFKTHFQLHIPNEEAIYQWVFYCRLLTGKRTGYWRLQTTCWIQLPELLPASPSHRVPSSVPFPQSSLLVTSHQTFIPLGVWPGSGAAAKGGLIRTPGLRYRTCVPKQSNTTCQLCRCVLRTLLPTRKKTCLLKLLLSVSWVQGAICMNLPPDNSTSNVNQCISYPLHAMQNTICKGDQIWISQLSF